ncbi:hypothetical protein ACPWSR_14190 [Alloiococcus sp. CFN-8]|uniref:hypothetical protein n=1 Tax=Alloiococcus sp. CFN-8 TaxID=3416081 RepID=UPI003CF450E3
MDVFKAYERQRRYMKRFNFLMIFLFFLLPAVVYYTGKTQVFFLVYLGILEVMIVATVIVTKHKDFLDFDIARGKVVLKLGILKKKHALILEKIMLVHTEGENYDIRLFIITTQRGRDRIFKPVTEDSIKKYPLLHKEYIRLKRLNPEFDYYAVAINNGGFYKYELLNTIYKNTSNAVFTDYSIDNIKKIRYV